MTYSPVFAFIALIAVPMVAIASEEYPMIRDTRNMRGSVTFINAQSRVSVDGGVRNAVAALDKELHWDIRVTNTTNVVAAANAASVLKSMKTTAAVIFVYRQDFPILSAYPDARVAVVNVAPLTDGGKATERQLEKRIRSESLRAFAFAFGAGFSQYKSILMSHVETLAELDVIPSNAFYPQDTLVTLKTIAESLGIGAYVDEYYETACMQGWAPPPTNDAQRTIWKQVHTIPDKPITIEFDPKKDK